MPLLAAMQKCPLCDRKCPGGHFHALEAPGEPHLCGREHACVDPATNAPRACACAGLCDISSRLEKERKESATVRVYQGKRDKFEYVDEDAAGREAQRVHAEDPAWQAGA